MLEARDRTARLLPLDRKAAAPAQDGVTIRPAEAEARFSLRLRDTVATAAGTSPRRPNQHGLRRRAPLGRPPRAGRVADRRAPETDADLLAAAIGGDLAGRVHSLVDVSHRNVGIEVGGALAARRPRRGLPPRPRRRRLPRGQRHPHPLLGKAEIVLIRRPGAVPTYRVECWRSFSTYVYGLLQEAAFGVGPSERAAAR